MASLAQLMFQAANQNIRDTKSDPSQIAKSFSRGAQIALQAENLENQRQRIADMRMQVEAKGVEQVMKAYQNADKFKSEAAAQRYIKHAVPAAIKAYNLEGRFTPEMQEMLMGSREARDAANLIVDRVRTGEIGLAEGLEQLNMNGLADYAEMRQMQQASEFAQSEKNKTKRTFIQAGIKQEAEDTKFDRTVEVERRRKAAADHSAFTKMGGLSKIDANLDKARSALNKLKTGKVKTGTGKLKVLLNLPFTEQMNTLRTIDSDLALVADQLQSAINVKKSLDSQFSDAMAVRVFSRIFDPLASKEANVERIENFIRETEAERDAQVSTFREYGLPVTGGLKSEPGVTQSPGATEEPNTPPMSQEIADRAVELIKNGNYGETPIRDLPGEQIKQIIMQGMGINEQQADNLIKQAGVKSGRNSNLSE